MNDLYTIYMHENKINGKKYVGITQYKDVNYRWKDGIGYSGQVFGRAIKKYGWDNFNHVILEENVPAEIVLQKEDEYILQYESLFCQHGYNMCLNKGGKETNLLQYNSVPVYQFDIYGNFLYEYNIMSIASIKYNIPVPNILQACKSESKYSHGFLWEYQINVDNPYTYYQTINTLLYDQYYPIYQFDKNGHYINSYSSAHDAMLVNPKWYSCTILDVCRGIYKISNNYVWRFQKDVPDLDLFEKTFVFDNTKKPSKIANEVIQFDMNGHYVTEYKSAQIAAQKYGCDSHTITYACSGRTLSGAGYLWRYKKDWDGKNLRPYKKPMRKNTKIVVQKDLQDNVIAYYLGRAIASKHTNTRAGDISAVCYGRQKTANGFKWSYIQKEDVSDNIIIINE